MATKDPLDPRTEDDVPTDGEVSDDALESVVGGGPPGTAGTSVPGHLAPLDGDDDTGTLFI